MECCKHGKVQPQCMGFCDFSEEDSRKKRSINGGTKLYRSFYMAEKCSEYEAIILSCMRAGKNKFNKFRIIIYSTNNRSCIY